MLLPHHNLIGAAQVVSASNWKIDSEPVGESVPWQPGLDLNLDSELWVDRRAAADILGFDPRGSTSAVVEWSSDSTRLRENCGRFEVDERIDLSIRLPGDRIGGRMTLRRRLVTTTTVDTDDPFAPSAPGALIWEDRVDFRVEGAGPQFPVITTSFEGAGLAGGAAWAVRVPVVSDLLDTSAFDEPASEHVCIRLNGDHPLALRIAAETPGDELAGLAQSQIACDLARGLIPVATSPEFTLGAHAPGTLGALVTTVLRHIGVESAVELDRYDGEEVAALIQDRFLAWGAK